MESEKVKEIKETIQETIDGKLSNKYLTICEISCCPTLDIDKLFVDILTLINELQEENETLRNAKVVYETVDYCAEDLRKAQERIAELEKEIEENAFFSKGYAQGIKNTYEVVVPEKLKHFAEIFKQKCIDGGIFPAFVARKLEETLKEFIPNESDN